MALSLTTLIQESRNLLGDLAATKIFTDAQITDWINQCIRELSIHFPRIVKYTVNTVVGTRAYSLEAAHTGIISVEYPPSQTPPVFLKRRSYTHPLFYQEDGYYDFLKPTDATSTNLPQLFISEKPTAIKVITIYLYQEHSAVSAGADTITIQDRHAHLIGLFVYWCAWQELAMNEGMYPGPILPSSPHTTENAEKAERAYRTTLAAATESETESAVMPWKADKFDGSY